MILQKILWTPELGYDVAGVVSFHETDESALLQVPVVGTAAHLAQVIDEYEADEVIIALPEDTSHHDILWLISECERGRVTIRVYPDLFQIMAGPVGIGEMGGIPILTVRDIALTGWRRVAKRLMDIAGSAVGMVFLSPLMLLVAALIKLESPGPVFLRAGADGAGCEAFPDPQIPVDARRMPRKAGRGRRRTIPGAQKSARSCERRISTSFRSLSIFSSAI